MTEDNHQTQPNPDLPTIDFVCGLIACHGSFGWTKIGSASLPVFQLKMRGEEIDLLQNAAKVVGLTESIHNYQKGNRHFVLLIVRKAASLDKLIHTIDHRLWGIKKTTFETWRDAYYRHRLNKQYNVSQGTT